MSEVNVLSFTYVSDISNKMSVEWLHRRGIFCSIFIILHASFGLTGGNFEFIRMEKPFYLAFTLLIHVCYTHIRL